MGYLTTITIYNDGCDQISKHPEEFAEKVSRACLGVYTREESHGSFGLGYHGNLVTVQKPRHADDETIYVHSGNTLMEMNPYSEYTVEVMKRNPKWTKGLLKMMKARIKELEKIQKEIDSAASSSTK
jgi:hypothetical protein